MVNVSFAAKKSIPNRQNTTVNYRSGSGKVSKRKDDETRRTSNAKLSQKKINGQALRSSIVAVTQPSMNSDLSADEADEPQPESTRRKSLVHKYAEKLSEYEYKCTMCLKVSPPHTS
ncbi:unnamed protein product [Sphagnum balticum]